MSKTVKSCLLLACLLFSFRLYSSNDLYPQHPDLFSFRLASETCIFDLEGLSTAVLNSLTYTVMPLLLLIPYKMVYPVFRLPRTAADTIMFGWKIYWPVSCLLYAGRTLFDYALYYRRIAAGQRSLPTTMPVYIDDPELSEKLYLRVKNGHGSRTLTLRLLKNANPSFMESSDQPPVNSWHDLAGLMWRESVDRVDITLVNSSEFPEMKELFVVINKNTPFSSTTRILLPETSFAWVMDCFSESCDHLPESDSAIYSLFSSSLLIEVIEYSLKILPIPMDSPPHSLELQPQHRISSRDSSTFIVSPLQEVSSEVGSIVYSSAGRHPGSGFIFLATPSRTREMLMTLSQSEDMAASISHQSIFDTSFLYRLISYTQLMQNLYNADRDTWGTQGTEEPVRDVLRPVRTSAIKSVVNRLLAHRHNKHFDTNIIDFLIKLLPLHGQILYMNQPTTSEAGLYEASPSAEQQTGQPEVQSAKPKKCTKCRKKKPFIPPEPSSTSLKFVCADCRPKTRPAQPKLSLKVAMFGSESPAVTQKELDSYLMGLDTPIALNKLFDTLSHEEPEKIASDFEALSGELLYFIETLLPKKNNWQRSYSTLGHNQFSQIKQKVSDLYFRGELINTSKILSCTAMLLEIFIQIVYEKTPVIIKTIYGSYKSSMPLKSPVTVMAIINHLANQHKLLQEIISLPDKDKSENAKECVQSCVLSMIRAICSFDKIYFYILNNPWQPSMFLSKKNAKIKNERILFTELIEHFFAKNRKPFDRFTGQGGQLFILSQRLFFMNYEKLLNILPPEKTYNKLELEINRATLFLLTYAKFHEENYSYANRLFLILDDIYKRTNQKIVRRETMNGVEFYLKSRFSDLRENENILNDKSYKNMQDHIDQLYSFIEKNASEDDSVKIVQLFMILEKYKKDLELWSKKISDKEKVTEGIIDEFWLNDAKILSLKLKSIEQLKTLHQRKSTRLHQSEHHKTKEIESGDDSDDDSDEKSYEKSCENNDRENIHVPGQAEKTEKQKWEESYYRAGIALKNKNYSEAEKHAKTTVSLAVGYDQVIYAHHLNVDVKTAKIKKLTAQIRSEQKKMRSYEDMISSIDYLKLEEAIREIKGRADIKGLKDIFNLLSEKNIKFPSRDMRSNYHKSANRVIDLFKQITSNGKDDNNLQNLLDEIMTFSQLLSKHNQTTSKQLNLNIAFALDNLEELTTLSNNILTMKEVFLSVKTKRKDYFSLINQATPDYTPTAGASSKSKDTISEDLVLEQLNDIPLDASLINKMESISKELKAHHANTSNKQE
ncbi:hypothetical protein NX722_21725 [Endozoicomonas gorgoniicola]|uniref:Uncharacterized protein n=1 Tax=Endozoicomonas gorgoniicola TaxID=1234144 RepID=A0ABT3N0N5_9GAMM|nr:hypothetical protein [Endozoicomonas gorgoniicola]MCW7555198.1 hypothetical protein [Endozoicomonas gorgoniicola]